MASTNSTKTNGTISTTPSNSGSLFVDMIKTLVIVCLVYIAFFFCEIVYNYINRLSMNRVELLPNTYSIGTKTVTITQNPLVTSLKQIQVSDNERTGTEFTYSFYLQVDPSAFQSAHYGLLHLFHKGYAKQFPLLAPGVYMHATTNTMRVYMNTFKTWNNYIDIDNFPLSKWVHVAIVCKNSALEVFINGNLSKKMSFDGFAAYQNYQDVICFSQRRIPSSEENGLNVVGSVKGMLSRLTYFNYALCYAEIQKEMSRGPSSTMESSNLNAVPPYLSDTWWTASK